MGKLLHRHDLTQTRFFSVERRSPPPRTPTPPQSTHQPEANVHIAWEGERVESRNRDWDNRSNRGYRNEGHRNRMGRQTVVDPSTNNVQNRPDEHGKRFSGNRRGGNRNTNENEEREWRSNSPMSARNYGNRRDYPREIRQVWFSIHFFYIIEYYVVARAKNGFFSTSKRFHTLQQHIVFIYSKTTGKIKTFQLDKTFRSKILWGIFFNKVLTKMSTIPRFGFNEYSLKLFFTIFSATARKCRLKFRHSAWSRGDQ